MPERSELAVRVASAEDAGVVGQLLHDFNREFDEPAPDPEWLAGRIRELLGGGATAVLVGGPGPASGSGEGPAPIEGLAVLRFRPAIWTGALECYLAELYVVPDRRGRGLGRALLEEAIEVAREAGADRMDLGTSESDVAALALYERLGFSNREGSPHGPIMYVYEREL